MTTDVLVDSATVSAKNGSGHVRLPLLAQFADPEDPPPFRGKRVWILMHMLPNLIDFLNALESTGLDPTATEVCFKDYAYGGKEFVLTYLSRKGYHLVSASSIEMFSSDAILRDGDGDLLVIEDGGLLARRIFADAKLSGRCLGVVEQTTRGIRRIEEAALKRGESVPFPIISVPHWTLKSGVEPPYIGEAAVRAVQTALPHIALRNHQCAVLGVGVIGSAVVNSLGTHCARVTFYDPDPEKLLVGLASLCGKAAGSPAEAVAGAEIVFGTSGSQSVGRELVPHLRDNVWLVSVSSETEEFDLKYLASASTQGPMPLRHSDFGNGVDADEVIGMQYVVDGKRINVLDSGRPVNFRFSQMSDEVADLVLTGMFLGAVDLARGRFHGRKGILTEAINEVARRHKIAEAFLKLLEVKR